MIVIAVDVGTTSVRLAIISFEGDQAQNANVLAYHKEDISCRQEGLIFEQNSKEIWQAICLSCKSSLSKANIDPTSIKGIAFSATCSLVILKDDERNNLYDIIMWADHRALEEAQKITQSQSEVLKQFGGVCSPEFSLSKLVWLKEYDKELFESSRGFFELPDWLVYRCCLTSGDDDRDLIENIPRSSCSVTCKWGYNAELNEHCDIIKSLDKDISSKIGNQVLDPGTVSGRLSLKAARELCLVSSMENKENFINNQRDQLDIVVGTSLIDAHSGMLSMLSAIPKEDESDIQRDNREEDLESTLCILSGTSSCLMLLSKKSNFTQGIWGPYKNVVLKDYYLLEAGQSMTGKLIELCIESHEEGRKRLRGCLLYDIISDLNEQIKNSESKLIKSKLHILPTYHGNRSPLANPRLKGGIYGLRAESKPMSLLEHYIATIESLIYETKLIVQTLGPKQLKKILLSGGMMKNEFYMQTLADVLNCQVVIMGLGGVDFMVMGGALVARHAILSNSLNILAPKDKHQVGINCDSIKGLKYKQLETRLFKPNEETFEYHEKKYSCYKEFVELSLKIDKIMMSN